VLHELSDKRQQLLLSY